MFGKRKSSGDDLVQNFFGDKVAGTIIQPPSQMDVDTNFDMNWQAGNHIIDPGGDYMRGDTGGVNLPLIGALIGVAILIAILVTLLCLADEAQNQQPSYYEPVGAVEEVMIL